MVLARRQHGFRKKYHRYRIGGCIRAIRDVNEGPRIVIDGDIRDSTTRVFLLRANKSQFLHYTIKQKNRKVGNGEPTRKCEADLREYET